MKKALIILLMLASIIFTGCEKVSKSVNTDLKNKPVGNSEEEISEPMTQQAEVAAVSEEKIAPAPREQNIIESNKEEMNLEEIIKKFKNEFNISDDYDEISTSESSENMRKIHTVNYYNTKTNDSAWFTSDIYGNIMNFGRYSDSYNNKSNNFSKLDGEEKLREVLDKIYGVPAQEFIITSDNNINSIDSPYFSFEVVRSVNGIRVPSDYINVELSKNTMDVTNFNVQTGTNYDFSDTTYFEDIEGVASEEEAFDKFIEYNKLYSAVLGVEDLAEGGIYRSYIYKPVLALIEDQVPLNAKDLEPSYSPLRSGYIYKGNDMLKAEEAKEVGLSPTEEKQIKNIENQATLKDAEDKARQLFDLEGYKLNYSNFSNYYRSPDHYTWTLTFKKNDDNIYVAFLANDLTLINFEHYYAESNLGYDEKSPETYAAIGNEFLSKKANISLDTLVLTEHSKKKSNGNTHVLNYARKLKDGRVLLNDTIVIVIDKNVDKVSSYNKSWTYNYEDIDYFYNIDQAEAYDKIREELGFEMVYMNNNSGEDEKVKAFYCIQENKFNFSGNIIVDGENGDVIDFYGSKIKKKTKIEYEDIDQAENPDIILKLAENGVGFTGGKLNPKEGITQIELFRILASSSVYDVHPDDLEEDAVYKFLEYPNPLGDEEREPDKIILQRDYARYLSRILEYEKIAKMNNIFKDSYEDITSEDSDFGYLVLAKANKLINTENDNLLNPDKEITREQALYYYYKLKVEN